jgi:hypothetical protein
MLKEVLKNAKDNNRFIGIWVYGDSDGFWSGYVQDFNDEFVIIKHFTKFGKYDGIIIEKIENIESIDFEDDYSEGMEYIIANNQLLEKEEETEVVIIDFEQWQYNVLLPLLNDMSKVVKIQISKDNYYNGFVKEISKDFLILKVIGSNGEDNGNTIYKIDDITSIRINDIESRKRLMLYNWKNI